MQSRFLLRTWALRAWVVCACVFLASCASSEKPKPLDLGANTVLMGVETAWKNSIGVVQFPLKTSVVGNQIFVASSKGTVVAVDADTGKDLWRVALDEPLSAGVGSDGRFVAVVNKANELLVLEAGKVLWRQKLSAVSLTAPLVAGARVFSLSADRTLQAFDAQTGRRLWRQQKAADSLVLGQAGLLFPVANQLLLGAGGHLLAVNPDSGAFMWDVTVANSRGTNEVERLVDIVAGYSRDADQVCVRAFYSNIACIDALQGRAVWSKSASGVTGLTGDAKAVYGIEADGRLIAWQRKDGERLWSSDRLRFRQLSTPLLLGRSLVVGDESGVLHFLSKEDGAPLNRVSTDGAEIQVSPVLANKTLVVVTAAGGLYGFRPQ